ncbi:ead/Ea22-like family protein [Edwardsiella ictaluri]|nr:ead/Ea22-like family protein [Edwardsiella ictaluri]
MNKVDKQVLRALAQAATQGEWDIDYPDDGFNSDDALIQRDTVGMLPICVVEGAYPESGFDEGFQKEQQANARYISAANPSTMLALLDENELLAAENERLKQSANEMQAQGVECCAAWFHDNHEYCRLLVTMMREFARNLREAKA